MRKAPDRASVILQVTGREGDDDAGRGAAIEDTGRGTAVGAGGDAAPLWRRGRAGRHGALAENVVFSLAERRAALALHDASRRQCPGGHEESRRARPGGTP